MRRGSYTARSGSTGGRTQLPMRGRQSASAVPRAARHRSQQQRRRDHHTLDDAVSVAATRPAMITRNGRAIAALIVGKYRERDDRDQVEEAEGVNRRNSAPESRGAARTAQNTPHVTAALRARSPYR